MENERGKLMEDNINNAKLYPFSLIDIFCLTCLSCSFSFLFFEDGNARVHPEDCPDDEE